MTTLNFPPPPPETWSPGFDLEPDWPYRPQSPSSSAGGPEGGRKSDDGEPEPGGGDPSKPSGENKPTRPKPGLMNGPFKPESDWSRRLDAHRDDLAYWKNIAGKAVEGLGMGLDYLTGKNCLDGLLRAFDVPTDPLEAATNILGLPTSPSALTKVFGEMIYNGSSLTAAISTVVQDSPCFVCR